MAHNKIKRVVLHYRFRKARHNLYVEFEAFDRPIPKQSKFSIIKEYIRV